MLPTALCAALESAINRVLALDPEALARLRAMQGKVIAIELRGVNIALYLLPEAGRINVFSQFDGTPDTVLRGTPLSMARMGLTPRAGDVLFAGDVEITGDVELGQQFRALLDTLDIDWEEHLSHVTGDVIAHQVGKTVRGALHWGRQSLATAGQNLKEYLQEERRTLPTPGEVEDYLAQIDTLRNDVDRLAARIARLEQRRAASKDASA